MALKFIPEETLSSFSYSPQLFRSTHDAIIDERSAEENDEKSDAQKEAVCAAPKSSLSFELQLGDCVVIAPFS